MSGCMPFYHFHSSDHLSADSFPVVSSVLVTGKHRKRMGRESGSTPGRGGDDGNDSWKEDTERRLGTSQRLRLATGCSAFLEKLLKI